MKFQILVPQYQETDSVVKPLLDSLAIQQAIPLDEIGAVICNDGSDVFLSDEFLNSYPYKIEYHKEPHRGVSATRNACLDYATADYVMFCDADDMFFSACGIWIIFQEMKNGFDALSSVFIEESKHPETGELLFVNHEMDSTFVHGKTYRRQYLLDKNIRFNPKLTIHEDSFFNILALNLCNEVRYSQVPYYLWKWRDESVCRHDPKYILKTYNNMLDSNDALIDEFLSRAMQDKATFFGVFMIFDAYYTMNKPEWIDQENQEYRFMTEKHFSEWFKKHKDMWENIPMNDKMQISNQVRQRSVMEGMRMEAITIENWLKHIEEM